jgi:hypothetical protein
MSTAGFTHFWVCMQEHPNYRATKSSRPGCGTLMWPEVQVVLNLELCFN